MCYKQLIPLIIGGILVITGFYFIMMYFIRKVVHPQTAKVGLVGLKVEGPIPVVLLVLGLGLVFGGLRMECVESKIDPLLLPAAVKRVSLKIGQEYSITQADKPTLYLIIPSFLQSGDKNEVTYYLGIRPYHGDAIYSHDLAYETTPLGNTIDLQEFEYAGIQMKYVKRSSLIYCDFVLLGQVSKLRVAERD